VIKKHWLVRSKEVMKKIFEAKQILVDRFRIVAKVKFEGDRSREHFFEITIDFPSEDEAFYVAEALKIISSNHKFASQVDFLDALLGIEIPKEEQTIININSQYRSDRDKIENLSKTFDELKVDLYWYNEDYLKSRLDACQSERINRWYMQRFLDRLDRSRRSWYY
jgi:hypothetical protein